MAETNFTIDRFRIRASMAARVIEVLQKQSEIANRRYLSSPLPEGAEEHIYAADARRWLEGGGAATFRQWQVSDENEIERAFLLPSGRPDVTALDHCTKFRMSIQSQSIHEQVTFTAASGPVPGDVVWASFTLTAPEDQIDAMNAAVREIIEDYREPEQERVSPPFKVFIGHGSDPQWKYLQRALQDTYGMVAEAFESSQRAGWHTLVVVEQMVKSSAVAVIVMTGEDEMPDGTLRARENVIHEVGFCQGALGIDRTIVVLERGVSEPSNIAGLTQIRFDRGRLIDAEKEIVEALEQRRHAHTFQTA